MAKAKKGVRARANVARITGVVAPAEHRDVADEWIGPGWMEADDAPSLADERQVMGQRDADLSWAERLTRGERA